MTSAAAGSAKASELLGSQTAAAAAGRGGAGSAGPAAAGRPSGMRQPGPKKWTMSASARSICPLRSVQPQPTSDVNPWEERHVTHDVQTEERSARVGRRGLSGSAEHASRSPGWRLCCNCSEAAWGTCSHPWQRRKVSPVRHPRKREEREDERLRLR